MRTQIIIAVIAMITMIGTSVGATQVGAAMMSGKVTGDGYTNEVHTPGPNSYQMVITIPVGDNPGPAAVSGVVRMAEVLSKEGNTPGVNLVIITNGERDAVIEVTPDVVNAIVADVNAGDVNTTVALITGLMNNAVQHNYTK